MNSAILKGRRHDQGRNLTLSFSTLRRLDILHKSALVVHPSPQLISTTGILPFDYSVHFSSNLLCKARTNRRAPGPVTVPIDAHHFCKSEWLKFFRDKGLRGSTAGCVDLQSHSSFGSQYTANKAMRIFHCSSFPAPNWTSDQTGLGWTS